jgi:hypothetical protein
LDDEVGETTGVALEGDCCGLGWADGTFNKEGVFLVSGLEEVEMIVNGGECGSSFNTTTQESSRTLSGCSAWRVWKGASARGDLCLGTSGVSIAGRHDGDDEDGRHEDNVVSVEEATVVRILKVVRSISEASATGGSLLVQGI